MNAIKTLDPADLSQPSLHQYLLTAVAPRPICFASTIDSEGNVNLSPFSFFNVFSSNPPIMVFSPARSGRDNTTKDTYKNILEVKEVVINIVNHPIVEQMSLSSTAYARGVNEFTKSGLTEVASKKVRPPRVAEAPVAFECVVDRVIELGDGPGAGNLILAKVVLIHLQEKYLDETGYLDTVKLDLVARMGGSWYSRVTPQSLFEIPKPIRTKGIGVDQLPEHIRNSTILTGNNLGRLGNVEMLPSPESVQEVKKELEGLKPILEELEGEAFTIALHRLAQELLANGETEKALKILLI